MSQDSLIATISWPPTVSGRPPGPARTSSGSGTANRRAPGLTAGVPSGLERRQYRATLGNARVGIDLEHTQRGVRSGDGARLADRLPQAPAATSDPVVEEPRAAGMRGTESLDGETQRLGRRRQQLQALTQREGHARGVRGRLSKDDAFPPRPALDERRAEDRRAQRPATAVAAGQKAVDEQRQRTPELDPRRRFLELEHLLETLLQRPRHERRIATEGKVMGDEPRRSEAVGDSRARQRRERPERDDAQLLQRIDERTGDLARAQQRHRLGGQ